MTGKCMNCEQYGEVHLHHIVPKSNGGTENIGNKVSLCLKCHGLVHDKNFVRSTELIHIAMRKAKAEGRGFGRPRIEINDKFIVAYNQWKAKQITAVKAMELAGMKKVTFYARVKEYEYNK